MAVTATLHTGRFPIGTSVGAFKRSAFPAVPAVPVGAPAGSADVTASVDTDGALAFAGLDPSTVYVAHASVGGEHRYVSFFTDAAPEVSGVDQAAVDASIAAALLPVRRRLYVAEVLADGPVAYWPLDEAAGATMNDASRQGNDGAYVNTPTLDQVGPVPGGKAVRFTAAQSEYAVATLAAALADVQSIEAWVKVVTVADCQIFMGAADLLMSSDGSLGFLEPFGARLSHTAAGVIVAGAWRHLVATKNGATAKIYLDGASVGTSAGDTPGTVLAGSTIASIASWQSGGAHGAHLDGLLADIALYDTALSADRVFAHYQAAVAG